MYNYELNNIVKFLAVHLQKIKNYNFQVGMELRVYQSWKSGKSACTKQNVQGGELKYLNNSLSFLSFSSNNKSFLVFIS